MKAEPNENIIKTINRYGKIIEIPKDTVIFKKGDEGENFYYILEGSVNFKFHNLKPEENFGKGYFFGELAYLMEHHKRSATATTKMHTVLAEITPATASTLIKHHGNIVLNILKNVCGYFLKSENALILDLKKKNSELEKSLNYLRNFKVELDEKELILQTDELTGLYNRRCLNLQFEKYIDGINKKYESLGIIMIDLDNFKSINDTYGHNTGDEILIETANIIQQSIRKNDIPCRLGGDEFIILLPLITEKRGMELTKKIQEKICTIQTKFKDLKVSVSTGGTMHSFGESSYDLMDRVDQAMYHVKKNGKNGFNWES